MSSQQSERLEAVWEDPQVVEAWGKLVKWLDSYGRYYWNSEQTSLVTKVEMFASAALRAAERAGVDGSVVAQEISRRVQELLRAYNVRPELIDFEPKGMRKSVAEVLSIIFSKPQLPTKQVRDLKPKDELSLKTTRVFGVNEVCPQCGSPLVYLKTLGRYYCFVCKKYCQ